MDKNTPIREILAENSRRRQALDRPYDPITGLGCCGDRTTVAGPCLGGNVCHLPRTMLDDPRYPLAKSNLEAWQRLRFSHDFEYWCAVAVHIKDKMDGRERPFVLNAPQRRVASVLEAQRLAGKPIRIIMLKARQWGGSTLVQMYMAWIQTCHRRNWHSLICAHVKDTAVQIRGMYTRMLQLYPHPLWDGDADSRGNPIPPGLQSYQGALNTRVIAGRGCRVTIGSSESQEAVRGADFAMAHLSEAAFWGDSTRRSPDDFIRAISGAIALAPLTLVAVESTANGVGNWFHREWKRSEAGLGDKQAVFVPWYEIEIYRAPLPADPAEVVKAMDAYAWSLWERGCTLEMIWWYICKRREYPHDYQMHAEYPTTPDEAFSSVASPVFDPVAVERMRSAADTSAVPLQGEVYGLAPFGEMSIVKPMFHPGSAGSFQAYRLPQAGVPMLNRYVVGVDVGGRSASSDYSVIVVIDRLPAAGGKPVEVVAQWRGHIDHDILAWKAAAIARFYCDALLVVESNTLETEAARAGVSASDAGLFVLSRIAEVYPNVYTREIYDEASRRPLRKLGFHTNRATKAMLVANLVAMVRDAAYIDPFPGAVNELATYEARPNGTYAARAGCNDDMLMARALALLVSSGLPLPRVLDINALPRPKSW